MFSQSRRALAGLAAALLAGVVVPPAAAEPARDEAVIGSDWVITHGPDVVERTAAHQLADHLTSTASVTPQVVPAGRRAPANVRAWLGSNGFPHAGGLIVIGTVRDHPLLAGAHRTEPFTLPGDSPEGYHLSTRTVRGGLDAVYIAGASPKGAMNGVFRFEEQLRARGGLDVSGLERSEEPAFVNRVSGHRFTQAPPENWTEDQQGEYYAANYLNVVWGEKQGPPLSAETRRKYGLKLAYEVRLPPVGRDWLHDPANAPAICVLGDGNGTRTIDPFNSIGRQAYFDAFTDAINTHSDLAILETLFGDYSKVPTAGSTRLSDGEPCGYRKDEAAVKIMRIMKEAVGDRPITPMAWMWHLYPVPGDRDVMARLRNLGVGILYNEQGNGDNWNTRRTNFNNTAVATDDTGKTLWGPNYHSLVSAAGVCESTKPAIGLPMPHVAASKLRTLADIGVRNFYLWWGGAEGWSYSANMSVIREMIWNPNAFDPTDTDPFDPADPERLMSQIAVEDFGAAKAPDILRYWGAVDHALVDPAADGTASGLPVYSWYQRLAIYLNPAVYGGGAALRPLTPAGLKSHNFGVYRDWGTRNETIIEFTRVADNLAVANALGEEIDDGSSVKLAQMRRWTEIYSLVFTSRLHFLRGLAVADQYTDVDDPRFASALRPITVNEIATTRQLADVLAELPPNATFFDGSRVVFNNGGDRDKDIRLLHAKRLSMRAWYDGMTNVAAGAPAIASSAPNDAMPAANAVDGNWSTAWQSGQADTQWLRVDLGSATAAEVVVVRWTPPEAAADSYRIQVANSPTGPWSTVATVLPTGRDDAVRLPAETSGRFLRVLANSPHGTYYGIRELEVYAASG